MPSGNTNILKEYINKFKEFSIFYKDYAINDFDKYLSECNDILSLDDYYKNIESEINSIQNFVKELTIVLRTNQQKNESKYQSYIEEASKYMDTYISQKNSMQDIIDDWHIED